MIGYEKTADHLREHAGTLRAGRRRRRGDDVPLADPGGLRRAVGAVRSADAGGRRRRGDAERAGRDLPDAPQAAARTWGSRATSGACSGGRRRRAGRRRSGRRSRSRGCWPTRCSSTGSSSRACGGTASEVLAEHRAAIGTEIEGKPATLSGLMAVAQHAGPGARVVAGERGRPPALRARRPRPTAAPRGCFDERRSRRKADRRRLPDLVRRTVRPPAGPVHRRQPRAAAR